MSCLYTKKKSSFVYFFSFFAWFPEICGSNIPLLSCILTRRGRQCVRRDFNIPETEEDDEQTIFHRLLLFVHPPPCRSNIPSNTMANVADTRLYDILGVSPSATENELKKVS